MQGATGGWAGKMLRAILTRLNRLRKAMWRVTGRPAGAHALALTPEGRLVLVRLRYAEGWRLPGGAVKTGEAPEAAMLRELGEEIGLLSHGAAEAVEDPRGENLFILREARYAWKRSLEIEAICEVSLDADLEGLSPATRERVERHRPRLCGRPEARAASGEGGAS